MSVRGYHDGIRLACLQFKLYDMKKRKKFLSPVMGKCTPEDTGDGVFNFDDGFWEKNYYLSIMKFT